MMRMDYNGKHHVKTKEETYQSELDSILMQFASKWKRAIKRAISGKTSAVICPSNCYVSLWPVSSSI